MSAARLACSRIHIADLDESVQRSKITTWPLAWSLSRIRMSPGRSALYLITVETSSRLPVQRLSGRCQAIETKPEQSVRYFLDSPGPAR